MHRAVGVTWEALPDPAPNIPHPLASGTRTLYTPLVEVEMLGVEAQTVEAQVKASLQSLKRSLRQAPGSDWGPAAT
eukprot:3039923-Prymnesium_polylepis.2